MMAGVYQEMLLVGIDHRSKRLPQELCFFWIFRRCSCHTPHDIFKATPIDDLSLSDF